MALIYILFFFIIIFIAYIKFSTCLDVINLFNLVWCIPAALANTGIMGFYKPSIKTNIVIITTILFFNIGYFIVAKYKFVYKQKNNVKNGINEKNIIIINILTWVTFIPYTIKAINVMRNKGFEYLRGISFTPSAELVGSTIELMYCQTVVAGVFTATIIIFSIYMVLGQINKKLILISCVDILLYSFTFAGRVFFFKTVIFLLLAFIVAKRMKFKTKIVSKKLKIVIVLGLLIFMAYFTINRSSGGTTILESVYIYFVGPFPFLDSLLNNVTEMSLMLGKGVLGIITVPISTVISFITGAEYMGADYLITSVTANQAYIGEAYKFNAFSTSAYVFIRDFGYFGVIIIPLILGGCVYIINYVFNKNHNIYNYSIYVLILYIVLYSPLRYELIFPIYAVIIIMIYIFTREKNEKNEFNFNNNG